MNWLKTLTYVLVIIGALNWGLVGFFSFDLVQTIFGVGAITAIIYDLIGLSAVYMLFMHKMK